MSRDEQKATNPATFVLAAAMAIALSIGVTTVPSHATPPTPPWQALANEGQSTGAESVRDRFRAEIETQQAKINQQGDAPDADALIAQLFDLQTLILWTNAWALLEAREAYLTPRSVRSLEADVGVPALASATATSRRLEELKNKADALGASRGSATQSRIEATVASVDHDRTALNFKITALAQIVGGARFRETAELRLGLTPDDPARAAGGGTDAFDAAEIERRLFIPPSQSPTAAQNEDAAAVARAADNELDADAENAVKALIERLYDAVVAGDEQGIRDCYADAATAQTDIAAASEASLLACDLSAAEFFFEPRGDNWFVEASEMQVTWERDGETKSGTGRKGFLVRFDQGVPRIVESGVRR